MMIFETRTIDNISNEFEFIVNCVDQGALTSHATSTTAKPHLKCNEHSDYQKFSLDLF